MSEPRDTFNELQVRLAAIRERPSLEAYDALASDAIFAVLHPAGVLALDVKRLRVEIEALPVRHAWTITSGSCVDRSAVFAVLDRLVTRDCNHPDVDANPEDPTYGHCLHCSAVVHGVRGSWVSLPTPQTPEEEA